MTASRRVGHMNGYVRTGAVGAVPEAFRLRNDLYCVEWGVKLYSLTHAYIRQSRRLA